MSSPEKYRTGYQAVFLSAAPVNTGELLTTGFRNAVQTDNTPEYRIAMVQSPVRRYFLHFGSMRF